MTRVLVTKWSTNARPLQELKEFQFAWVAHVYAFLVNSLAVGPTWISEAEVLP